MHPNHLPMANYVEQIEGGGEVIWFSQCTKALSRQLIRLKVEFNFCTKGLLTYSLLTYSSINEQTKYLS